MKLALVVALLLAIALILTGAYMVAPPLALIVGGILILLAIFDLSRKDRAP